MATHAANGLTYDQLNIAVSGNNRLSAGTAVTISIPSIYMPLSTKPLGVFVLYTATDVSVVPNVKIESALDGSTNTPTSTNYFTMTTAATTTATV